MRKIPTTPTIFAIQPTTHKEERVAENGRLSFENVDDVAELPPIENFDLDHLLKAGIPLQETRTNILPLGDSELLEHLEEDADPEPPQPSKKDLKNE